METSNLEAVFRDLTAGVDDLVFSPPVTHVYNPLSYAGDSHRRYLTRFGTGPKRVVFLGMNPGPFGMAQTGIPFGDVETVGEWLRIRAPVGTPPKEHPRRPIQGLDCPRVEVSGRRLWGWIRSRWKEPQAFFRDHFVANYCPLVFLEESGRNRTPDRLPSGERKRLFDICDDALQRMVSRLEPEWIVGIGAFAARRAEAVLRGRGVRIARVLHPSPASPAANRGWREAVERQLEEQGVFQWNETTSVPVSRQPES